MLFSQSTSPLRADGLLLPVWAISYQQRRKLMLDC